MNRDEVEWAKKINAAKEEWVRIGRLLTGSIFTAPGETAAGGAMPPPGERLPPGQKLVRDWPVLDLGNRPNLSRRDWKLTVGGLCENPLEWTFDDFDAQRHVEMTSDIHCVTGWSAYDNRWRGLSARRLLEVIQPRSAARFVIIRSFDTYATTVPIQDFMLPDTILATHWNGQALTREHGGPVRLVLPRLYFWKSPKWIKHIWLTDKDVPGYWEARGYHRRGDPWREERYDRS